MNRIVILMFGTFVFCSCSEPSTNESALQNFLKILKNSHVNVDQVRQKALALNDMKNHKAAQIRTRDSIVDSQLLAMRTKFNSCDIVSYLTYDQVKKTVEAKSLEPMPKAENENQSVYYITCNDKVITPILLESGKVASTTTMTKGTRRYFIRF
ncbi:hypothetical protein [Spongiimicrobium sp. 3-5]|uniref:hypothetical protein n=1 Tax=Spongiimicrobium sp. 3-5 TaxID=3332596 RepID=UPI0039802075